MPPVISTLIAQIRTGPERLRFLLFALAAVGALAIGFIAVPPSLASELIAAGGYYYLLTLFAWFLYLAWRVARARREIWPGWLRRPGWTALILTAATAVTLWFDPFQPKILFDDYVVQATAWHMHATKEVGTVIRAYDLFGTWLPIDTFLDKRPYFFPLLLSLVHDLTGYRPANVFFLNGALTAGFFALLYWFAREVTDRVGGWLVVALMATLPLLGQSATSTGMEVHNLFMLLVTMCAALLYVRVPTSDRLALLCVSAVLLAQSRYESVVFVAAVGAAIVAGWWRGGRVLLPPALLVTPLLLVPYAWHNRVLSASPLLWQLQEGQTSRFSFSYLAGNLEGAWKFFFNTGPALANSWWLSLLGLGSLLWLAGREWRRRRSGRAVAFAPGKIVLTAFGVVVAGNLAMLMFYYWARLDDVVASRFALPGCVVLGLVSALAVRHSARAALATRGAFIGLGVFVLVSAFPAMAHRLYTSQNLVMHEIDWERDLVSRRGGPRPMVISNTSTIPWVLWRIPAVITGVARMRTEQLAWHLRERTFSEILVIQALRPTDPGGRFGVDPDDAMPESFRLEKVAEKRFGGRMVRVSRLARIEAAPAASGGPPAAKPAPNAEPAS